MLESKVLPFRQVLDLAGTIGGKGQRDSDGTDAPRVTVHPTVAVSEIGAGLFPESVTPIMPKLTDDERRKRDRERRKEARYKLRMEALATNCEHCDAEIQAYRRSQRFCSDRCRKAAKRAATQT